MVWLLNNNFWIANNSYHLDLKDNNNHTHMLCWECHTWVKKSHMRSLKRRVMVY